MKDFAAAVAMLDAKADARLGDSFFYDVGGFVSGDPVNGWIIDPAELSLEGLDAAIDAVGIRRRCKIARTIVAQPTREDRIRGDHRLLEGRTWKPTAWRPITNGRYWLIDLERTSQ
jgi:hypothetical protein